MMESHLNACVDIRNLKKDLENPPTSFAVIEDLIEPLLYVQDIINPYAVLHPRCGSNHSKNHDAP